MCGINPIADNEIYILVQEIKHLSKASDANMLHGTCDNSDLKYRLVQLQWFYDTNILQLLQNAYIIFQNQHNLEYNIQKHEVACMFSAQQQSRHHKCQQIICAFNIYPNTTYIIHANHCYTNEHA